MISINRPLIALAGLVAASGVGIGVYLVASSGGDEEVIQQVATPTPSVPLGSPLSSVSPTIPADLPPPAAGYVWYVTPSNDLGLLRYAVQVPSLWQLPSGLFYSNPQYFAPEGTGTFGGPAITVAITPVQSVQEEAFRQVLPWQAGSTCVVRAAGQSSGGASSWRLFSFTCPAQESAVCRPTDSGAVECMSEDQAAPVSSFDGRAAEVLVGSFHVSIVAYLPPSGSGADAPFEQAIASFTPR